MVIQRDSYLNKLISLKNINIIKVITGIRRCGKSYLLNNLFHKYLLDTGVKEDHIISIAFDKKENERFRDANFLLEYVKSLIIDSEYYYLLFDEVQLIKDSNDLKNKQAFFEVLNSLLHINNCDIYVTGSNSQFLSHDVMTTFRGRGFEIRIFPLTFKEFFDNANMSKQEAFELYLTYGGLPLILSLNDESLKSKYLKDLFSEIYEKDLKERYKIKNDTEFSEVLDVAASQIGGYCNYSNLSRTFKSLAKKDISDKKIKDYYEYFLSAFIIDRAQKYDIKSKKYINASYKYYFEDPGLRNARLNFRQIEKAHLMENIIYNELRYRGFNVDIGNVTIKEKDKNSDYCRKDLEIDFVCNKGSKRYYIQSAYSILDDEKLDQEKKSLLHINDSFKKIIITYDNSLIRSDDNGIVIMNLFDFLLNENSLEF